MRPLGEIPLLEAGPAFPGAGGCKSIWILASSIQFSLSLSHALSFHFVSLPRRFGSLEVQGATCVQISSTLSQEPRFPTGRKGFYAQRLEEHHVMVSRMNDEAGTFGFEFRVQGSGSMVSGSLAFSRHSLLRGLLSELLTS